MSNALRHNSPLPATTIDSTKGRPQGALPVRAGAWDGWTGKPLRCSPGVGAKSGGSQLGIEKLPRMRRGMLVPPGVAREFCVSLCTPN